MTHDIGVVAYMADEVAVMKDGVIVESGSVHEVLKSPKMFIPNSFWTLYR